MYINFYLKIIFMHSKHSLSLFSLWLTFWYFHLLFYIPFILSSLLAFLPLLALFFWYIGLIFVLLYSSSYIGIIGISAIIGIFSQICTPDIIGIISSSQNKLKIHKIMPIMSKMPIMPSYKKKKIYHFIYYIYIL